MRTVLRRPGRVAPFFHSPQRREVGDRRGTLHTRSRCPRGIPLGGLGSGLMSANSVSPSVSFVVEGWFVCGSPDGQGHRWWFRHVQLRRPLGVGFQRLEGPSSRILQEVEECVDGCFPLSVVVELVGSAVAEVLAPCGGCFLKAQSAYEASWFVRDAPSQVYGGAAAVWDHTELPEQSRSMGQPMGSYLPQQGYHGLFYVFPAALLVAHSSSARAASDWVVPQFSTSAVLPEVFCQR